MEDYQRAVERLDCFALVSGHDVVVRSERPATPAERAAQIGDAEALVLIRERTPIDEAAARAPPPPAADLPDGPRDAAHRPRRVHAARDRRLQRIGIAVRARRADAGADPRLDAAPRRPTPSRCAAGPGRRRSVESCTAARSGSSATGRSARSSPATATRSGCTCSPGAASGSLERAAADGHEAEPDLDALCARARTSSACS